MASPPPPPVAKLPPPPPAAAVTNTLVVPAGTMNVPPVVNISYWRTFLPATLRWLNAPESNGKEEVPTKPEPALAGWILLIVLAEAESPVPPQLSGNVKFSTAFWAFPELVTIKEFPLCLTVPIFIEAAFPSSPLSPLAPRGSLRFKVYGSCGVPVPDKLALAFVFGSIVCTLTPL